MRPETSAMFDFSFREIKTQDDMMAIFREIAAKGGFNNDAASCYVDLSIEGYIRAQCFSRSCDDGVFRVGRYHMNLFIKP